MSMSASNRRRLKRWGYDTTWLTPEELDIIEIAAEFGHLVYDWETYIKEKWDELRLEDKIAERKASS